MSAAVKLAKNVLKANRKVLYGIFGMVAASPWFPPVTFLNEFLQGGQDPCDQDGRMPDWQPFSLTAREYEEVKRWWLELHPHARESDLGVSNWSDWCVELLHGDDES